MFYDLLLCGTSENRKALSLKGEQSCNTSYCERQWIAYKGVYICQIQFGTHTIYFPFNEGIGDGGNELGMGKVKEALKKHIKNGDIIACDVEADFTIVAGK